MNPLVKALELYRDLKISKSALESVIKTNDKSNLNERSVIVQTSHLINLLRRYQNANISIDEIIEWVNIVWFSDWFEYANDQCDSIASIMNELEELDEKDYQLTDEMVEKYIQALEMNVEI